MQMVTHNLKSDNLHPVCSHCRLTYQVHHKDIIFFDSKQNGRLNSRGIDMPIRTALKKPRFAICFQISIISHMLKFMLSPSLLGLPLEYYFPFQINRFTGTKHRNKVISFRQNVSRGTFSHIENHSPNCTFSNNPFNLLTGISLPMDIVLQPRTTSKNKKNESGQNIPDSLLKFLAESKYSKYQ